MSKVIDSYAPKKIVEANKENFEEWMKKIEDLFTSNKDFTEYVKKSLSSGHTKIYLFRTNNYDNIMHPRMERWNRAIDKMINEEQYLYPKYKFTKTQYLSLSGEYEGMKLQFEPIIAESLWYCMFRCGCDEIDYKFLGVKVYLTM